MMYLVTVDRWGSYGYEEPQLLFHCPNKAQQYADSMDENNIRDSYSVIELEVGDAP